MTEPQPWDGGDVAAPRLVTPALLREWSLPEPTGTKYSRGQVVVVGGAARTPGAVMLAGLAALRCGAGRLSLAVADGVATSVAVAVPESGVHALAQDADGSVTGVGAGEALADELAEADAVLVGPGLDDAAGAVRLIEGLSAELGDETRVVLDAYGVTVLPDVSRAARSALAGRLLLTANTGELARVTGRDELEGDAVPEAALTLGRAHDAVVASGGWIVDATSGGVWRLTTGDTGLGTSGSGDVLAGAITGLLARGADPVQATVWGAHAHAAAGDALAAELGRVGFVASEIVTRLPVVLSSLGGD